MRRREFFGVLASAAIATPLPVPAQQPAIPVVGFLTSYSVDAPSAPVEAIHLALGQAGYEVGKTVRMEYRFANNQLDRLPAQWHTTADFRDAKNLVRYFGYFCRGDRSVGLASPSRHRIKAGDQTSLLGRGLRFAALPAFGYALHNIAQPSPVKLGAMLP